MYATKQCMVQKTNNLEENLNKRNQDTVIQKGFTNIVFGKK